MINFICKVFAKVATTAKWIWANRSIAKLIRLAVPSKHRVVVGLIADGASKLSYILAGVAVVVFIAQVAAADEVWSEVSLDSWFLVVKTAFSLFGVALMLPRSLLLFPIIINMFFGKHPSRYWLCLAATSIVSFEIMLVYATPVF
jgi:hypothetical protein